MNYTYRQATPADRADYIDFINMVFSQHYQPHDFKALLPKEYGDGRESRAIHFLALDEAQKIRGVIAVLPFDMIVMGRTLKFGYVGSVSVHPYARGEGHMKRLMAMAQQWMRENGMDASVLGGLRQRYQYFGYSKGGLSVNYVLNSDNVRHALKDVLCSDLRIEEVRTNEDERIPELLSIHDAQPVHAVRSAEQFLDICSSWFYRPYAVMRGGIPIGYLCANDHGNINELLMRNAADYPSVLKAWMTTKGAKSIEIAVEPTQIELIAALDRFAEDTHLGEAENLRIFNWKRVLPAYLDAGAMLGRASDGECSLIVDGESIHLCRRDGRCTVDEEVDPGCRRYTGVELQEAVFRPASLFRPESIGGAPKDWFPLPLSVARCDGF